MGSFPETYNDPKTVGGGGGIKIPFSRHKALVYCPPTLIPGKYPVNQPCSQMWQHSCLFPSELEKLYSWLSEDDIAKFLTKTEWKKCKNMQNILLDGCYLFFEEYLREKHLFIFPNHSEK